MDATLMQEFSTAGYRFGHSLLIDKYPQID